MKNRRDFIDHLLKTAGTGSMMFWIQACSKQSTSPLHSASICQNICTGCGDCAQVCPEDAVMLEADSRFVIHMDLCTECGDCIASCEYNAIQVAQVEYELNSESCVGCGECITVCEQEGNCIFWERDYYKVRGKCKPDRCQHQCATICPENAISVVNDQAVIDSEKCTRCGKCISVCPFGAVNPAHVYMEQEQCINCGKCWSVCEFDAVSKIYKNDLDTRINAEKCKACAVCLAVCPEGAIKAELHKASVIAEKCTVCGDCREVCLFDAVRLV